jgi:hypothetical protein
VWACSYLAAVLVLTAACPSSPLTIVFAGAFLGAVALEVSRYYGGDCPWLPEARSTLALFHILAVVVGAVVLLPAIGAWRAGGLFRLFPILILLSFSAFFAVHLRDHAGPPTSDIPASAWLRVVAGLPFYALGLFAAAVLVLLALALLHKR